MKMVKLQSSSKFLDLKKHLGLALEAQHIGLFFLTAALHTAFVIVTPCCCYFRVERGYKGSLVPKASYYEAAALP